MLLWALSRRLAGEDVARVFITDSLLTTLMCAPRSVYSWDIVVTRAGDKLFFDKRDGSNLDLLTVAETAPDPLPEDKDSINGVQQLSLEATAINQNFSQQVGLLWTGPSKHPCPLRALRPLPDLASTRLLVASAAECVICRLLV